MQQVVDPFMPVTMQLPHRRPIQVQRIVPRARAAVLPRRTIDGMVASRPTASQVRRTFVSNSEFRRPLQPVQTTNNRPVITEMKSALVQTSQPSVFEEQFVPAAKPQINTQPQVKAKTKSRAKRILNALQVPAIILISVIVGYLMQSLVYGEIAIGIYAACALIFKVASRTTFMLAMLSLIVIIATVLTNSTNGLSQNFAVYTFLLLAVGTVSLGREARITANN